MLMRNLHMLSDFDRLVPKKSLCQKKHKHRSDLLSADPIRPFPITVHHVVVNFWDFHFCDFWRVTFCPDNRPSLCFVRNATQQHLHILVRFISLGHSYPLPLPFISFPIAVHHVVVHFWDFHLCDFSCVSCCPARVVINMNNVILVIFVLTITTITTNNHGDNK